jgi:hypothetical protein
MTSRYDVTVGIPSPRCPPPAFGMNARRIPPGRYLPASRSALSLGNTNGHRSRSSPSQGTLTALHSRSEPQRIYGFVQTRPHGTPPAHRFEPAAGEPPGELRAAPLPPRCRVPQSFGCRLDPPQLLAQLARGSKPLRGEHPAGTVARAAGAPAVDRSTPSGHFPGAFTLRGGRRDRDGRTAAGPRTPQRGPEPRQTPANDITNRGRPEGREPENAQQISTNRAKILLDRTQEVGGSSPPSPMNEASANAGVSFARLADRAHAQLRPKLLVRLRSL